MLNEIAIEESQVITNEEKSPLEKVVKDHLPPDFDEKLFPYYVELAQPPFNKTRPGQSFEDQDEGAIEGSFLSDELRMVELVRSHSEQFKEFLMPGIDRVQLGDFTLEKDRLLDFLSDVILYTDIGKYDQPILYRELNITSAHQTWMKAHAEKLFALSTSQLSNELSSLVADPEVAFFLKMQSREAKEKFKSSFKEGSFAILPIRLVLYIAQQVALEQNGGNLPINYQLSAEQETNLRKQGLSLDVTPMIKFWTPYHLNKGKEILFADKNLSSEEQLKRCLALCHHYTQGEGEHDNPILANIVNKDNVEFFMRVIALVEILDKVDAKTYRENIPYIDALGVMQDVIIKCLNLMEQRNNKIIVEKGNINDPFFNQLGVPKIRSIYEDTCNLVSNIANTSSQESLLSIDQLS